VPNGLTDIHFDFCIDSIVETDASWPKSGSG